MCSSRCQQVPVTRCQPRLRWQRRALPVPDICAVAGAEPGRWPRASGQVAAQAPGTANCSSPPCSRARRWDAQFWGGRGACLHPRIDRGLLLSAETAWAHPGSSATSSLCYFWVSRGLARLIKDNKEQIAWRHKGESLPQAPFPNRSFCAKLERREQGHPKTPAVGGYCIPISILILSPILIHISILILISIPILILGLPSSIQDQSPAGQVTLPIIGDTGAVAELNLLLRARSSGALERKSVKRTAWAHQIFIL